MLRGLPARTVVWEILELGGFGDDLPTADFGWIQGPATTKQRCSKATSRVLLNLYH